MFKKNFSFIQIRAKMGVYYNKSMDTAHYAYDEVCWSEYQLYQPLTGLIHTQKGCSYLLWPLLTRITLALHSTFRHIASSIASNQATVGGD